MNWSLINMKINRNRLAYFILIIIVVIAGLASRHYAVYLPQWLGNYAGDSLWALMVFLILGFCLKKGSTIKIAFYAMIFSYAIEISQIYHAPWIDAVRKNIIGGLILGFGFQWSDLCWYTIGILIGVILEYIYILLK